MSFERRVDISPAFDKRHSDPKKNYGIGSATLRMVLIGEKGATQFVLFTGWDLPHVAAEMMAKPIHDPLDIKVRFMPSGADVGCHSLLPLHEGQDRSQASCEYLGGRPCYYDGSALMSDDALKILLSEGSDGIWKYLEERYDDWLTGPPATASETTESTRNTETPK
jgi:hypothetical protein